MRGLTTSNRFAALSGAAPLAALFLIAVCGVPAAADDAAADPSSVVTTAADDLHAATLTGAARARSFLATGPNRDKIEAALDKISDVEFIDTRFASAIDFLAERHRIAILPDEKAMEKVEATLDTQVNLVLSGVSLRNVLDLLLDPLELDYGIDHDVLLITTREKAARLVETRLYDVRDFPDEYSAERLAEVIRRTVRPETWRGNVATTASRTSRGFTLPSFNTGRGDDRSSSRGYFPGENPPASASASGDGVGAVESLPGALVVTHTQRTHREVAALLDQFATFLAQQPAVQQSAAPAPAAGAEAHQVRELERVVAMLQSQLKRSEFEGEAARRQLQQELDKAQKVYRESLVALEQARRELAELKAKASK